MAATSRYEETAFYRSELDAVKRENEGAEAAGARAGADGTRAQGQRCEPRESTCRKTSERERKHHC